MGKIELESLRKRARAAGIDHGAVVRARRARALDEGTREWCPFRKRYVPSAQTGLHEPPQPALIDPRPLPMDSVRRWVVAVCSPSRARGVAEDLCEMGFVAYCPLSRKVHLRARARVGRQKMIRQYPVFGSYIFVGEVDEPLQASIHDGIAGVLGDSLGALAIPSRLVLAINQAELDGKWDESKAPAWETKDLLKFKKGGKVSVLSGPFACFGGFVEECSKAGVKVGIDIFGRVTPVEFEPSALELA